MTNFKSFWKKFNGKEVEKEIGVSEAGPVPNSLLAEQDLEGEEKTKKSSFKNFYKTHLESEIKDEQEGSEHYNQLAEKDPENADKLHQMALDEAGHETKLEEIEAKEEVTEKGDNQVKVFIRQLRERDRLSIAEIFHEVKKAHPEVPEAEIYRIIDSIDSQKTFKSIWTGMRKGMNLRALASIIYNQLPDAANTTSGSWKSWAKTKLQQSGPLITPAEREQILEMVEEMVEATRER